MKIGPVIRPKTGHNRFCGPAALSMILGIDTAEAAALLRKVSRKKAIRGVYDHDMRKALEARGFRVLSRDLPDPRPTLARWLKENPASKRGDAIYLITAAHHYVTIQGRRGGCNQTKGPVALKDLKKRRGYMQGVMVVMPPTQEAKAKIAHVAKLKPFASMETARAALAAAVAERDAANLKIADLQKRLTITRDFLADEAKRASRNSAARARRQAQALAKAVGCEIEVERVGEGYVNYWVTHPAFDEDETGDPCEGDHICTGWEEVLSAVESYRDHFNEAAISAAITAKIEEIGADGINAARSKA